MSKQLFTTNQLSDSDIQVKVALSTKQQFLEQINTKNVDNIKKYQITYQDDVGIRFLKYLTSTKTREYESRREEETRVTYTTF